MKYLEVTLLVGALVSLSTACTEKPNHAPSLHPIADRQLEPGQTLAVDLVVEDPEGRAIELTLADAPDGATLVQRQLTWTPDIEDIGSHWFAVRATDVGSPPLSSYVSFTVTVRDPDAERGNHAPVADPVPERTVLVGELLEFDLAALDPDGDPLSWEAIMLPSGATFDSAAASFSWTPDETSGGRHHALFRVSDDGTPALHDSLLVTIDVLVPGSGNLAPAFFGVPSPGSVAACDQFSASFEAVDPEGDPIEYLALNLPPGATLTPVGSTAVLDWHPTLFDVGSHFVAIYALDRGTPAMSAVVLYRVDVAATVPSMSFPDATAIGGDMVASEFALTPENCFDTTVSGVPTGATFDVATGMFTWTTEPADFGIYDITVTASDPAQPGREFDRTARITVQYQDRFDAYSGYSEHEVHLDFCCVGPVTYQVIDDGPVTGVLRSQSALGVDVQGYAYRAFDRSATPLIGVDYEFLARDVVVGPACGSGGGLQLYDFAVTQPTLTWPDWYTPDPAAHNIAVPNGGLYVDVSGSTTFAAPTNEVTVTLKHGDSSDICTVDVYWDRVLVTPLAAAP